MSKFHCGDPDTYATRRKEEMQSIRVFLWESNPYLPGFYAGLMKTINFFRTVVRTQQLQLTSFESRSTKQLVMLTDLRRSWQLQFYLL